MGSILLQLNGVSLIPESAMAVVRKVIASMNLVLRELVPGLTIEVEELGTQIQENGVRACSIQLMSLKNSKSIPPSSCSSTAAKEISFCYEDFVTAGCKKHLVGKEAKFDMGLLYKYFSNESEYALKNVENNHICFSSLETLNDPFEGVGSYLHQVSDEEKAYWESIGSDLPKLVSKRISDEIKEIVNFKYRVFCCCKEKDNPLLWAYYANSHQGFCVGYAQENIEKLSDTSGDIVYGNEMCTINDFSEEIFEKLLFHKALDWQREKEFRAIYRLKSENKDVKCLSKEVFFASDQDNGKINLLKGHAQNGNLCTLCSDKYIIKTCPPAVIYIGLRTPMNVRKKLMEISARNSIPIFQMVLEQNRYRFIAEAMPMTRNVSEVMA